MRAAPAIYSIASGPSLRTRAPALTFVVAVHILLIMMLIMMAPRPEQFVGPGAPLVVELISADRKADSSERKAATQQRSVSRAAQRSQERAVPKPQPRAEAPAPAPPVPPIELLDLTNAELASVRATMGSSRGTSRAGSRGAQSASADAASSGRGEGPGGAELHDVDWYRRPTKAELTPYLPRSLKQSGWGMVACKMVADYRVEDCREIGQSPAGSGFSRAVRQAAWQFRVIPPRINGRPLLGAWVRIRIEYSEGVPE